MDIAVANEALRKLYWRPPYRYPKYKDGPRCRSHLMEKATWAYAERIRKGLPDHETKHLRWYLQDNGPEYLRFYRGHDEDDQHGTVYQTRDGQWWWWSCCPPWMDREKCESREEGMLKADKHYERV